MKRTALALAFATSLTFGCAALRATLLAPQTPEEVFETSEAAYTSALETAVQYARACSSVPTPTAQCDDFIVRLRDINDRAQNYLFLGGMLSAGVSNCDETAEPGCTARQLRTLSFQLNELAALLARGEIDL